MNDTCPIQTTNFKFVVKKKGEFWYIYGRRGKGSLVYLDYWAYHKMVMKYLSNESYRAFLCNKYKRTDMTV